MCFMSQERILFSNVRRVCLCVHDCVYKQALYWKCVALRSHEKIWDIVGRDWRVFGILQNTSQNSPPSLGLEASKMAILCHYFLSLYIYHGDVTVSPLLRVCEVCACVFWTSIFIVHIQFSGISFWRKKYASVFNLPMKPLQPRLVTWVSALSVLSLETRERNTWVTCLLSAQLPRKEYSFQRF